MFSNLKNCRQLCATAQASLLLHAGLKAFFTTPQLSVKDKVANSLALGTSPIVRALIDPEGGMRDIRALDNISFADWFKSHGGSQGSIERMWDPIGAPLAIAGVCTLHTASRRRALPYASADHQMPTRAVCRWCLLPRSACCCNDGADERLVAGKLDSAELLRHAGQTLTLNSVGAAYALGFLDCKDISARCMLTIFQFFATKTDASKLRMLSGSPKERLLQPIMDYIEARGGRFHIRWGCRCGGPQPCARMAFSQTSMD